MEGWSLQVSLALLLTATVPPAPRTEKSDNDSREEIVQTKLSLPNATCHHVIENLGTCISLRFSLTVHVIRP